MLVSIYFLRMSWCCWMCTETMAGNSAFKMNPFIDLLRNFNEQVLAFKKEALKLKVLKKETLKKKFQSKISFEMWRLLKFGLINIAGETHYLILLYYKLQEFGPIDFIFIG